MDIVKIIFVVIAVIIVFLFIAYYISGRLHNKKLSPSEYGKLAENTVYTLLTSYFFKKNVFPASFYPYPKNRNGIVAKYAEIDALLITRGGIAVIEVKSHNGHIDNRDEDTWVQYYNDKKIEFYNPIKQNETHKKVISGIMKRFKLHNVPIKNIVVFTSSNADFEVDLENIVDIDGLVNVVRGLNAQKMLKLSEIYKIRKVLNTVKKSKHQVNAIYRKIYGK